MAHILITVQRFAAIGRRSSEILWLIKQESRAVAGNPRDAAVIFNP